MANCNAGFINCGDTIFSDNSGRCARRKWQVNGFGSRPRTKAMDREHLGQRADPSTAKDRGINAAKGQNHHGGSRPVWGGSRPTAGPRNPIAATANQMAKDCTRRRRKRRIAGSQSRLP